MQATLFDLESDAPVLPKAEPRKMARKTDPQTSHDAAEELAPKLAGVQIAVLAAIQDWPNKTSRELAEKLGWETGAVNKRTSELEAAGCIKRHEERRCSISGKKAATWTALVKGASRV